MKIIERKKIGEKVDDVEIESQSRDIEDCKDDIGSIELDSKKKDLEIKKGEDEIEDENDGRKIENLINGQMKEIGENMKLQEKNGNLKGGERREGE